MTVYKVLAFIGETSAGKDTLLNSVLSVDPQSYRIVSCTTRPPREKEVDGFDYYFLTDPEIKNEIMQNKFLELTSFNGWFYGTRISDLSKTRINIGVFNPEGIRKMLQRPDIDLRVIEVKADRELRRQRYLARDTKCDVAELERRLDADAKDFEFLGFDRVVLYNNADHDLTINTEKVVRWLELWRGSQGKKS
jgi:guanylate kinase